MFHQITTWAIYTLKFFYDQSTTFSAPFYINQLTFEEIVQALSNGGSWAKSGLDTQMANAQNILSDQIFVFLLIFKNSSNFIQN